MAQRQRRKTEYDINLFLTQPPEDPSLVKKLFCGREELLRNAVGILKSNTDTNGRRKQKRPWVVHGESRSGKSHLARRILCDLANKKPIHQQVIVSARERLEARNVMRRLFEEISRKYNLLTSDEDFVKDSIEYAMHGLALELIDRTSVLVSDHADSVKIQIRESLATAFEKGVKGNVLPKVFQIFLRRKRTEKTEETWEAVFRQLSALDLAEFCAALIDILWRIGRLTHIFVLLDDVDLLEGYESIERNGRIQRSVLTDALVELHQTPCVDVIMTARSWYAHNNRELDTLVDLTLNGDLDADSLIEIHNKHFDVFVGRKKLQKEFLAKEALQTLASDADGLPGVFLQHLRTAFGIYKTESGWDLRSGDWLLEQFRKIFNRYAQKSPEISTLIINAVRGGIFAIDVEVKNPLHNTRFVDEFVFQSYYKESAYFCTKLLQRVIAPLPGALLHIDKSLKELE